MTWPTHTASWLSCLGNLDEQSAMVGDTDLQDTARIEWTMVHQNKTYLDDDETEPLKNPIHNALSLTQGGRRAAIQLDANTYTLCITKAGKLILTK